MVVLSGSGETSEVNLQTRTHRILVIDDDALVRESLCMYLEDEGYQVLEAAGGQEGLQKAESEHPDVILCDLRMPDLDGLSVLRVLAEKSPQIPVIVVSGAGMIQDVVEALRLGATDYLVKPIGDMAVLEHAVESALHRQELEEENEKYRRELEVANQELAENLALLRDDQEAGRRAQLQLLPEPRADFNGVHIEHVIYPSLYLSGDFLDYFPIDETRLAFYIADISGHGSASAFVTMMLKSLINQPLREYRAGQSQIIAEPAAMCRQLNREVLSANLGKHLTLFYGVLDTSTWTLTYCNAGHFPRPVIRENDACATLEARGFPIGLFSWADYEEHQRSLSGDFVLGLFSDGVLEIMDVDVAGKASENKLAELCKSGQKGIPSVVSWLGLDQMSSLPDDVTVFLISGSARNNDNQGAVRD
jgi:serine phosphatase RsbU (regulator of sigma subunit)